MGFLPTSSDIGANTKGPNPKPKTNMVTDAKMITSSETPKYSAGRVKSPVTIAEPRATTKQIEPSNPVNIHFLPFPKVLGFCLSLSTH